MRGLGTFIVSTFNIFQTGMRRGGDLVTHKDRKYHKIFSRMCISCISPLGPALPEIREGSFSLASRQLELSIWDSDWSTESCYGPLLAETILQSSGGAMDK